MDFFSYTHKKVHWNKLFSRIKIFVLLFDRNLQNSVLFCMFKSVWMARAACTVWLLFYSLLFFHCTDQCLFFIFLKNKRREKSVRKIPIPLISLRNTEMCIVWRDPKSKWYLVKLPNGILWNICCEMRWHLFY